MCFVAQGDELQISPNLMHVYWEWCDNIWYCPHSDKWYIPLSVLIYYHFLWSGDCYINPGRNDGSSLCKTSSNSHHYLIGAKLYTTQASCTSVWSFLLWPVVPPLVEVLGMYLNNYLLSEASYWWTAQFLFCMVSQTRNYMYKNTQ